MRSFLSLIILYILKHPFASLLSFVTCITSNQGRRARIFRASMGRVQNHKWNESFGIIYDWSSIRANDCKTGNKKYWKNAESKLIVEFAQPMEYKTFHGVDDSSLRTLEKQKSANMINVIKEKINRGHTDGNPVIIAGAYWMEEFKEDCIKKRNSLTNNIARSIIHFDYCRRRGRKRCSSHQR